MRFGRWLAAALRRLAAGADTVQPGLRETIEKELTLLEGAGRAACRKA